MIEKPGLLGGTIDGTIIGRLKPQKLTAFG